MAGRKSRNCFHLKKLTEYTKNTIEQISKEQ